MCCFGMTKLLAFKLVGEAPSLLSVNKWIMGEAPSLLSVIELISGFCSVLLNVGIVKSDNKTVYKSPLMRTWRAGLETGFFSWMMLVVVWVLNDDLPSVPLFDILGSFSFFGCAAAMLIAVVFSHLRRDLVGPALCRVASPCWQHCFFCLSALVGFSGRIKGEIEGKNNWKAPLSLCPFIDFPDQVIVCASSGILVAAAALVTFFAKKKAFLSAAAFALSYLCAAAACSWVSGTAAAGNINANEGMFTLVGQVFPYRSLALVEIYLYKGIFVSAAALVKFHVQKKAFLVAAAFVFLFLGAAAAHFCVSCSVVVSMTSWAYGLVLGLRVLCACTTAMVVHARLLFHIGDFVFALDGLTALETDGMDRHVLAGRLFLGTGEQASGRVDVPGKDNRQHAAAASMGSGQCLEATRGVQICQPCQDSSAPPVIPVCSILVRTLSGRTRVCSLPIGFTLLDLENCVSTSTAVPCSSFYLTYQGKVLTADQVLYLDSGSPVPVVMHGRLCGGSAVPGAWVCNVCHASGCWPTKTRCFRCGHARNTLVAGAPALSPPAGREAAHPGRAPRAKAAPVNPTFRPPRVIPPKKSSSPANASSPPVSPPTQVSPELLVATLRALGIGEDLLKQIQSTIVPPAAPKVERKEQKLVQLRGLIETKKSQVSKLEKSVNHHRSQLEVCVANKQRREEELAALQAEYRSVTDGKLSPNSTPAASVASSKEPAESCDPDLMEDEPPPPEEGHPLVFEFPSPPSEDAEQRTKAKRLKTNDTHASVHGVGHDPAVFGQHIALCSEGDLDMYMKEIEKRRTAIVDAAASGVLIGEFEEEPDV